MTTVKVLVEASRIEEHGDPDDIAYCECNTMSTVHVDDAKANLHELIAGLNPGEQLVIVDNREPLATLTRTGATRWPCKAGSAKHTKHWMAPDFDAPLEDFREYME